MCLAIVDNLNPTRRRTSLVAFLLLAMSANAITHTPEFDAGADLLLKCVQRADYRSVLAPARP